MEIKKYDSYKDSGVEWIGKIPKHWKISKLKFEGKIYNGNSLNNILKEKYSITSSNSTPYIGSKDITLSNNRINYNNGLRVAKEDESNFKLAKKGSTLICIEGGSAGKKIAFLDKDVFFVNKLACIDSSKFVYYFIQSSFFQNQFNLHLTGLIPGVSMSELKNLISISPPVEEKTQIANYLDQKTAQIDSLISNKEKLIELLKEEGTAVINQAVTKGLDPNVPMKDSGIEWMGKIPEHWEVSKIKRVTSKIGSGVTPRGGAEVYQESGVPLIRSQNVYFEGLRLDNVAYITKEVHDSMNNSKIFKGDVLLNITGGSIGRCFFVSNEFKEANVNQHVCILRPNKKISTEFLNYLMSSRIGQLQIDLCQTGGNREAVNFEDLKNFFIPIPSFDEQVKITKELKEELLRIEELNISYHKEIDLLKEYKIALISEVVTGKVKVT